MTRISTLLFALAIPCLVLLSCQHQPVDVQPANPGTGTGGSGGTGGNSTPDTALCFERDVLPIFITNCATRGCHSGEDRDSRQDGYVLNSYESIVGSKDFYPGNPGNTKIFEAIIEDDEDDRMPYKLPALSNKDKGLIYRWILTGAQNRSCRGQDTLNPRFAANIQPVLNANCVSCHSSANPSKSVSLDSYPGVKAVAGDGRLVAVIKHLPGYTPMPLSRAKLPDIDIIAIEKWVLAGAQNN